MRSRQMMGGSRNTIYRCKSAKEKGGAEALLDRSRRKSYPENRVEPQIEQAVMGHRFWACQGDKRSPRLIRAGLWYIASLTCLTKAALAGTRKTASTLLDSNYES